MAIVTLRMSEDEEKIVDMLVRYFDQDKSKILKDALWDKFEDLRDRELVEEFEARSAAGKVEFGSADAILTKVAEKTPSYATGPKRPVRPAKKNRRKQD